MAKTTPEKKDKDNVIDFGYGLVFYKDTNTFINMGNPIEPCGFHRKHFQCWKGKHLKEDKYQVEFISYMNQPVTSITIEGFSEFNMFIEKLIKNTKYIMQK